MSEEDKLVEVLRQKVRDLQDALSSQKELYRCLHLSANCFVQTCINLPGGVGPDCWPTNSFISLLALKGQVDHAIKKELV